MCLAVDFQVLCFRKFVTLLQTLKSYFALTSEGCDLLYKSLIFFHATLHLPCTFVLTIATLWASSSSLPSKATL